MNTQDKLIQMFEQQAEFMKLLQKTRAFPEWPVDISNKKDQQLCREIMLSSVEEYFEAMQHLKNWKKHRATEVKDINQDEFLEELCDMMHYFIELLLIVGISADDFFNAYISKGNINKVRIKQGY